MTVTVCAQVTPKTNWFSHFAEELLFRARNLMKRKVIRVPVPWYEYLPAAVMNLNPSLKANFMTKKSTFTFYSVMKICNYNVPLKSPNLKRKSCAAILPLFLAKKKSWKKKRLLKENGTILCWASSLRCSSSNQASLLVTRLLPKAQVGWWSLWCFRAT